MPQTRCKEVYQFDELSDMAKERARGWWREHAYDFEWWDATYEDAERAGLKITEFDLDRRKHVKGDLTMTAEDSIKAILADHGKDCDTFKLAKEYKALFKALNRKSENYEQEHERLTEAYEYALCEEYASMLQLESEWMVEDAQVDDNIRANEYDFTEDGKRYA